MKLNKKTIIEKIKKLQNAKVLVVGDIILDEFVVGSPERISREAPVLILEHLNSSFALGGASNAAHNISALNAKISLCGVIGKDLYAKAFENECLKNNISPILISDSERPTTVKTRILSIAHKHPTSSALFRQQLLRLDRLSKDEISAQVERNIIKEIEKYIKKYNVLLISDYSLGLFTKKLVKELINIAHKNNLLVIVDTQEDFEKYKGVYLFTPNQPDTEKAVGFNIVDDSSLNEAGKKLLKITSAKYILITRGSDGMALFNSKNPDKPFLLPAFNVSEVFDVTGAGDTVAGVIAAALSISCSMEEACILGNLAASIVVRKYGTVVTSQGELLENLKDLNVDFLK